MYLFRNKNVGEKFFKISCISLFLYGFFVHLKSDFKFTNDVMYELGNAIYTAPLVRIVPYLLGTITAIYLHKNDNQITISKVRFNFKFTQQEKF